MKKMAFALSIISILTSCGTKVCKCDELSADNQGRFVLNGSSSPYSGTCQIKDNLDSVIGENYFDKGVKTREIKKVQANLGYLTEKDLQFDNLGNKIKGFELTFTDDHMDTIGMTYYENTNVREIKRKQINEKYVTESDMLKDKDGKQIEGYSLSIFDISGVKNEYYVYAASIIKKGIQEEAWQINMHYLDMFDKKDYSFSFTYLVNKGNKVKNIDYKPSCIPEAEYEEPYTVPNYDQYGFQDGISNLGDAWKYSIDVKDPEGAKKLETVTKCLSKDYPFFQYFKNN